MSIDKLIVMGEEDGEDVLKEIQLYIRIIILVFLI